MQANTAETQNRFLSINTSKNMIESLFARMRAKDAEPS